MCRARTIGPSMALAVVGAIGLAACSSDSPTSGCRATANCRADQICLDDMCVDPEAVDASTATDGSIRGDGAPEVDGGECNTCPSGGVETRPCGCGLGTQQRSCTEPCAWGDWSSCEGAPELPRSPEDGSVVCPPYERPAVFFAAHPDDETIAMAGAILEHLEVGRDVFIEVMTRGEATGTRGILADGMTHAWHSGTHMYTLSPAEIGEARTREVMDAAARLGVTGIYVSDFGDGDLTADEVGTRVAVWTTHGGDGLSLKGTAGISDPVSVGGTAHPDHAAVWSALTASGHPDIRGYYVYHYRTGAGIGFRLVTLTAARCAGKGEALDAYAVWDPDMGRYAIGYHSTASLFDGARRSCEEYVLVP